MISSALDKLDCTESASASPSPLYQKKIDKVGPGVIC